MDSETVILCMPMLTEHATECYTIRFRSLASCRRSVLFDRRLGESSGTDTETKQAGRNERFGCRGWVNGFPEEALADDGPGDPRLSALLKMRTIGQFLFASSWSDMLPLPNKDSNVPARRSRPSSLGGTTCRHDCMYFPPIEPQGLTIARLQVQGVSQVAN